MSTPLYQEALIEAKKLREAAAAEAKNAVLEAVQPLIKQMIDKEISGIILEQEETPPAPEASADAPPPAPPTPSPDAGATGPIDAAPASGTEVKPPMPGMTPAVSAAAPPIKSPGTDVIGKIDLGPAGEQQIVIPVDALFQKETTPAATGTVEAPTETTPAPEAAPAPEASTEASSAVPAPEAETMPPPESLTEIYRAVQKFLSEQAAPPPAPPAAPAPTPPTDPAAAAPAAPAAPAATPPAVPPATPPAPDAAAATPPTGDLNAAAGAAPAAPPAAAPAPTDVAAPPAPATPPATGAAAPPVTPAPTAAGVPAPAPVTEYKNFKTSLDRTEGLVEALRSKSSENVTFLKEAYEKQLFSLYNNLLGLKAKNAISPRLFSFNEDRLGLLYENLNVITSYKQNPLEKGINMANKNSLKDLVRALFEGAEGFEDAVGKVDPAGDSEGGSAEHAHKVSGNPKGVKAEAEAAPFPTKQKKEWPGKPSPESLLEQLEEEIGELMAEMGSEEEGMHEEAEDDQDEVVLELADEEVVMEARKARARLKALREQAEDKLSLTIDLDGVSGENVQNVNVSLDGEELEVEMDEEGEEEMDMSGEEEAPEEESSEEALMESRRLVRKAVNETKTLRGQLHETQLLTARSLYVNKLFVRDELTGAQKRKIVEYLDSANTIAEAKEIYNRLVRVLDAGKKNSAMIKESAQRPARMLTEAVVEPSFDTSRWQILAGMKRNAK